MTQARGNTPSVPLLHGLGGTGETLAPLAGAIEALGFTVTHPTLAERERRAALSVDTALSALTLDGLLDEAREHAKSLALGGTPLIACGHSNGALLAHTLAADGMASELVLMAPVPPPSVAVGIPAWLKELFFAATFGPCWRTSALHFGRRPWFDPDPPPGEVARTLIPDNGRVLAQAVRLVCGSKFDPDTPLGLAVAVVAGARDDSGARYGP